MPGAKSPEAEAETEDLKESDDGTEVLNKALRVVERRKQRRITQRKNKASKRAIESLNEFHKDDETLEPLEEKPAKKNKINIPDAPESLMTDASLMMTAAAIHTEMVKRYPELRNLLISDAIDLLQTRHEAKERVNGMGYINSCVRRQTRACKRNGF